MALFHKCFCILVRVWLYGTSVVLVFSGVFGFDAKRHELQRRDLYRTEQQLWAELGIPKRYREIQLDVLSFLGLALALVIAKYAPAIEAHHRLSWRINPFWLVGFWCAVAIAFFKASLSRPWAWGRNTDATDAVPGAPAE